MSGGVHDLRLGRYEDVLGDVVCDALISDPPYGERTHAGHDATTNGHLGDGKDSAARRHLQYGAWRSGDVEELVDTLAPRTRGWFAAMTSHDLFGHYEEALKRHDRYVFAPIPCVIRGMTVRLGGDGPSSWCVWLVVSRPRSKAFATWGTLPGAYISGRGDRTYTGGKPLDLMCAIVRDYSRPGDLICDPCAGMATTGVAAIQTGRRFVGSEVKPDVFAQAKARLEGPQQIGLFQ